MMHRRQFTVSAAIKVAVARSYSWAHWHCFFFSLWSSIGERHCCVNSWKASTGKISTRKGIEGARMLSECKIDADTEDCWGVSQLGHQLNLEQARRWIFMISKPEKLDTADEVTPYTHHMPNINLPRKRFNNFLIATHLSTASWGSYRLSFAQHWSKLRSVVGSLGDQLSQKLAFRRWRARTEISLKQYFKRSTTTWRTYWLQVIVCLYIDSMELRMMAPKKK